MDNSYEQQQIDLVAENEALKAQVNKLTATVVFANNVIDDLKPYSVNQRQMVNSYLRYTPEQCLNSVKALAAIELAGIFHDGQWRSDTAMLICEDYANKLRGNNEAS